MENVKRRRDNVKESIILTDLASKAIISKFSELMNDGGKHRSSRERKAFEGPKKGRKEVFAPLVN